MKVLVLQPPSPPFMNVKRDYAGGFGVADSSTRPTYGHDRDYITLPFMSALYTASVLEKDGHDVSFLDAQAERLSLEGVIRKVKEIEPEIIVSVVNLPSIYGDLKLLSEIKGNLQSVKIATIGVVNKVLGDLILESHGVDFAVRGDPEMVLPKLLERLNSLDEVPGIAYMEKGKLIVSPEIPRVTDLDSLPYPAYHLAPLDKYWYHVFGKGRKYASVFSSRGCDYKCYYCPYPLGFGDEVIRRDPKKVVDEIQWLKEEYGIEGILFRDQIFTVPPSRAEEICDEMIARNLNLEWVVETRIDSVNENLLRKMKAAGLKRIHYGLESGDPLLFASGAKRGVSGDLNQMIEIIKMTEKLGINYHVFILIGLLGETWDTIGNTIDTLKKIKPLTIQVSIATPYPGTPLFQLVKRKGLLLTEDWSQFTGFKPVMRTEALNAEELWKAKMMIEKEHRKASRWKGIRKKAELAIRYTRDGSILSRIGRKVKAIGR